LCFGAFFHFFSGCFYPCDFRVRRPEVLASILPLTCSNSGTFTALWPVPLSSNLHLWSPFFDTFSGAAWQLLINWSFAGCASVSFSLFGPGYIAVNQDLFFLFFSLLCGRPRTFAQSFPCPCDFLQRYDIDPLLAPQYFAHSITRLRKVIVMDDLYFCCSRHCRLAAPYYLVYVRRTPAFPVIESPPLRERAFQRAGSPIVLVPPKIPPNLSSSFLLSN